VTDPEQPTPVELPLAMRDALVRLLLADLASQVDSGAVREALGALDAIDATGGATHAVAPEIQVTREPVGLAALGRVDGGQAVDVVELREVARRCLRGYLGALAGAPRGIDLDTRLAQARTLLAHALFFEVHEVLEPPWRTAAGDERRRLQGIIQAAVAWHHGGRGRSGPALRASAAATAKLADAPPLWRGFPIGALLAELDAYRAALARGESSAPTAIVL
jgi:hypothetical protein